MDSSLLILIWVAIVAILLVSGFVIVTMLRIQEFLREAKQTVDNLNDTTSLVEKIAEQAAKGFFTITAAIEGIRAMVGSAEKSKTKKGK